MTSISPVELMRWQAVLKPIAFKVETERGRFFNEWFWMLNDALIEGCVIY